jgi:hypothetical protein
MRSVSFLSLCGRCPDTTVPPEDLRICFENERLEKHREDDLCRPCQCCIKEMRNNLTHFKLRKLETSARPISKNTMILVRRLACMLLLLRGMSYLVLAWVKTVNVDCRKHSRSRIHPGQPLPGDFVHLLSKPSIRFPLIRIFTPDVQVTIGSTYPNYQIDVLGKVNLLDGCAWDGSGEGKNDGSPSSTG